MGNQLNQWPSCALGECGELRGPTQPCSMPGPCEWKPNACECSEDSFSSQFFNDDDVLLERLEAATHGDRLLTKLHVNVALFSTTSCDIVEGLLQLTKHQQRWSRGEERSLHQSLHEALKHHARPSVYLMKTLQWVYRVEEMPASAALPARQCVLLFFSTMLAAAAALKWQRSPPAAWKRKGVEATDILRTVVARLSEVIAGLRFLACVALLQHCAEPSLLGSKKTMVALTEATGVKVSSLDDHTLNSLLKQMSETASPQRMDLEGGDCLDEDSGQSLLKPDAAWDIFFTEARRRPTEATVSLLRDLQTSTPGIEPICRIGGVGLTGTGPIHFTAPMIPQAALDTWDDELVFCSGAPGNGDHATETPWKAHEDCFESALESDVQVVVPL